MSNEKQVWEEFNLVVPTPEGDKEVRALRHRNSRGLAVVHNPFGFLTVTHVATGKKVGAPFERAGDAMVCMAQLALCFDWTGDAEGVKRERWVVRLERVSLGGTDPIEMAERLLAVANERGPARA